VVGAGGVAAYTEAADSLAIFIEAEAAAEDINSADTLADHWICFIERLERRLIEAGADMTFIRLVAYRQHQRAKVLARSARLSVTDDYDLLLVHSLELEPLACSLARVVEPAARLAITPGNKSALCPACTSG
jgi:hypothetical protein